VAAGARHRDARVSSDWQIAANRRNGDESRGPLTAEGKAVASRNALRHGLSRQLSQSIGPVAEQIAEFACQLVGDDAPQNARDLATMAAEAHFDLVRIQEQRQLMVAQEICGEAVPSPQGLARLGRIDRYQRRAETRRHCALRRLSKLHPLPIFK